MEVECSQCFGKLGKNTVVGEAEDTILGKTDVQRDVKHAKH